MGGLPTFRLDMLTSRIAPILVVAAHGPLSRNRTLGITRHRRFAAYLTPARQGQSEGGLVSLALASIVDPPPGAMGPVGARKGPIQCNSCAQLPAHYFPISRPCKRIMPSGTERNPCSFADITTILRRLHR